MRRRAPRVAAIVAVNLALLFGGLYLLSWRYRRSLSARPYSLVEMSQASGIPIDVLRGISFYGSDARHDMHAVSPRPPEVIRIGAFGDSFTFGDEVAASESYPARLQQLFRKDGFGNVEVINFGANGLGLSETTHLWEAFGKKLDLAFVVLGPMTLFPDREVTFNHFLELDAESIHGRYVLEDRALRWLDPIPEPPGGRRSDEYLRFIPRWIYLRYDRRPPLVLQALLPRGKTVRNPFYYRSDSVEDEAAELYPALLRRWASGGSQVVLTQLDEENLRYAAGLEDTLVIAAIGAPSNQFFTRRTMGHLAGTGNELVAEIVHDILLGKNPAKIPVLDVARELELKPVPPLGELAAVNLLVGDQRVARWIYVPEPGFTKPADEIFNPRRDEVRSVLFFDEGPFGTGVALTAARPFAAGEEIEAVLTCSGESARRKLGKVELIDGSGSLAEANAPALRPLLDWRPGLHLDRKRIEPPLPNGCSGQILVGGSPLWKVGDQIEMQPIHGRVVAARALPESVLDLARLPVAGPIRLELVGASTVTLTVGRFSQRTRELSWNSGGLHRRIAASVEGRGAEIVAP